MTDYIARAFANDKLIDGTTLEGRDLEEAVNAICAVPAADVKPVVLCRDCKHKGWIQELEHGKSVDYCRLIERCVDKQFFCAAGERKTNCGADMRKEDGHDRDL